jgi:hypothetical protein
MFCADWRGIKQDGEVSRFWERKDFFRVGSESKRWNAERHREAILNTQRMRRCFVSARIHIQGEDVFFFCERDIDGQNDIRKVTDRDRRRKVFVSSRFPRESMF